MKTKATTQRDHQKRRLHNDSGPRKKNRLTQSYEKAPTPAGKLKKSDNTKRPLKTSITQRLRTDLGRSVGVTTATQLVWLNRFTGSLSRYQITRKRSII